MKPTTLTQSGAPGRDIGWTNFSHQQLFMKSSKFSIFYCAPFILLVLISVELLLCLPVTVLECYNLCSGVKLRIRSSSSIPFILSGTLILSIYLMVPEISVRKTQFLLQYLSTCRISKTAIFRETYSRFLEKVLKLLPCESITPWNSVLTSLSSWKEKRKQNRTEKARGHSHRNHSVRGDLGENSLSISLLRQLQQEPLPQRS